VGSLCEDDASQGHCNPLGAVELPAEPLTVAKKAALAGGRVLKSRYVAKSAVDWSLKARNDYVTEADIASERVIVAIIRDEFPEHALLAEESGKLGDSDDLWIIDPLDGTANFVHGYPAFSVSIAFCLASEVVVGAVYDPLREELFWARKGRGAFLNRERTHVSPTAALEDAFLGTGFPFRAPEDLDSYLDVFRGLFGSSAGTRRGGSAALDLSYVACGRFDAFWEFYLKPWDTAAGGLLVEESGGRVTDVFGGAEYRQAGHILASNGPLHDELLDHVARAMGGRGLACAPPGYREGAGEGTSQAV
jgi:myo-inositol-1(or 4)-monophosphatase